MDILFENASAPSSIDTGDLIRLSTSELDDYSIFNRDSAEYNPTPELQVVIIDVNISGAVQSFLAITLSDIVELHLLQKC